MAVTLQRTGDEQVDRALSVLVQAIKTLEQNPLNQAVRLENVTIGTTDTRINHGLGRVPRGVLVEVGSAASNVSNGSASTNPTTFINLKASAPVTVSILVY